MPTEPLVDPTPIHGLSGFSPSGLNTDTQFWELHHTLGWTCAICKEATELRPVRKFVSALRVDIFSVCQKANTHLISADDEKCISIWMPFHVLSRECRYKQQNKEVFTMSYLSASYNQEVENRISNIKK